MISDRTGATDELLLLQQERDVFRKQFLRIQENYEGKIKELSVLKELDAILRSTSLRDQNTLFWQQLNIIQKYISVDSISLMLLNEGLQALEVVARSDLGAPVTMPSIVRLEDGAAGEAVLKNLPILVSNVSPTGSEKADPGRPNGSLLYIPLIHRKNSIGVLSFCQNQAQSFDQNQTRFLELVADQITTAVIFFRLYHQMLKEEKQRFVLSRFFSKTVTEKIFGSAGNIRLGGERKNVTILFADLRGFTALSEALDQEKVVEILNAFFSLMTPIIFRHDGTLDKLLGDGMLALFGAPLSHEDDSFRAVQTALDMISALHSFNQQNQPKNWPTLKVSIGINAGEVVAGYIGSEDHLNYTVIGDAVNVAQRIETIAGPDEILITRRVRDEIQTRVPELIGLKSLVPLPPQKVKGKAAPIDLFRVEI